MAGIGFELNKLIKSDSKIKKFNGYCFSIGSCLGSMVVGFILIFLIQLVAKAVGLNNTDCTEFTAYITNTVFLSMLVFSIFSLVLSRYLSDMIYQKKNNHIMASFWGAISILAPISIVIFAPILIISGVRDLKLILLIVLMVELVCCWLITLYTTILKNYKQITLAFLIGLIISSLGLAISYACKYINIELMISFIILLYGIVIMLLINLLKRNFETDSKYTYEFLKWISKYKSLIVIGFTTTLATIVHFYIFWFSNSGTEIIGLIRCNTTYDFPAIISYLSTVITTITFVTIFEPHFYKKYRNYFDLLNNSGNFSELKEAKKDMMQTLRVELRNLILKQIVFTLFFAIVLSQILYDMNIGFMGFILEDFKILCIGYALYAIGNVIQQVQLYFTDYKGAKRTGIAFLIATIVGSVFAVYLKSNYWGIGLVLGGLSMVLVGIKRLEYYLANLEYFILNESESGFKTNKAYIYTKKFDMKANKAFNKKNKKIAVICISVLVLCSIFGGIMGNNKNIPEQTFYPVKTEEILSNPGVGLAPWAKEENTLNMDTKLVYVGLSWAEWEPEEGVYDYEGFEKNNHLNEYKAQGRNVVFRFYCDYPSETSHKDIPDWLYKKINKDGEWYNNSYGKGFSPNYSNEVFIKYHEKAIKALGERYGNDDFFIYIELGSIGHWGEWHVNISEGMDKLPEYETRIKYIEPYKETFKNSTLLMRYPTTESEKYNTGLYNDMIGDSEVTNYWLDLMEGGIWEQTDKEDLTNRTESWKEYPIGGEFASSYDNDTLINKDLDITLLLLKQSHQSFIGPKIIIDENNETDYSKNMNEILKILGHRLYVEKCEIKQKNSKELNINLKINNEGIAPMYTDAKAMIYIYDENGDIVESSKLDEFDSRNTIPDNIQELSTQISIEKLKRNNKYTLCIGLVNEKTGENIIELAMEKYKDKTYIIGEFEY